MKEPEDVASTLRSVPCAGTTADCDELPGGGGRRRRGRSVGTCSDEGETVLGAVATR